MTSRPTGPATEDSRLHSPGGHNCQFVAEIIPRYRKFQVAIQQNVTGTVSSITGNSQPTQSV